MRRTDYFLMWAVLAVLLTAIAHIEFVHVNRKKVQAWKKQMDLQIQLEQEYSRLLLEKNTLLSPTRVDSLARGKLHFINPDITHLVK